MWLNFYAAATAILFNWCADNSLCYKLLKGAHSEAEKVIERIEINNKKNNVNKDIIEDLVLSFSEVR